MGIFILQNIASAVENIQPQAKLKMSDLVVFNEDGKFGLKDKKDNVIVKPEYSKRNFRFQKMDKSQIVLPQKAYFLPFCG